VLSRSGSSYLLCPHGLIGIQPQRCCGSHNSTSFSWTIHFPAVGIIIPNHMKIIENQHTRNNLTRFKTNSQDLFIYIYVCACKKMNIYIYTYICMQIKVYIYMYVCMYVNLNKHMYIYRHMCVNIKIHDI
jgi:hypothetical protein